MTRTAVVLGLLAVLSGSQAALIQNLPGQPAATFKQYSGYFSVGKTHQLHYWFVESANNPATDPVLVWLTGGPGCSGLSALLTEWGPFMVNSDGLTLSPNPYSWNRNASILTLESPAGVGYSYATDGNITTGDDQTASENWQALVAFFNTPEFTQYKNNDFYVTGESYGGIYVPTLVQTILDRQSQFKINLKGTAIGNGCVSENEGTDSLVLFEYHHGLIDDTKWQQIKSQCCQNNTDDCAFHSYGLFTTCGAFVNNVQNTAWGDGINAYNMYASCSNAGSMRYAMEYRNKMKKDYIPTGQASSPPCMDEDPVTNYLNRADVRKALFIPSSLPAWDICNDQINQKYRRQYSDMTPQLTNALNQGVKVMIYSGDVDMACNFLMGQRFTRKLGIPVKTAARKYNVNGQVGGFHTQYGSNLHFVTVRGAGHMVPTDKPDVAFHILDSFLNNKAF